MADEADALRQLTIAYYVTGHGYGHATRVVEVCRQLIARGHRVHVVTAAPEHIFTRELGEAALAAEGSARLREGGALVEVRNVVLDVGARQRDAPEELGLEPQLVGLEVKHRRARVGRGLPQKHEQGGRPDGAPFADRPQRGSQLERARGAARRDVSLFFTSFVVVARRVFPDERGFSVCVNRAGEIVFEPQDSDVVCFRSEGAGADGYLHSVVYTGGGEYSLPPLATVTLESVQEPGEWEANGHRVQRRLYTVRVSYKRK